MHIIHSIHIIPSSCEQTGNMLSKQAPMFKNKIIFIKYHVHLHCYCCVVSMFHDAIIGYHHACLSFFFLSHHILACYNQQFQSIFTHNSIKTCYVQDFNRVENLTDQKLILTHALSHVKGLGGELPSLVNNLLLEILLLLPPQPIHELFIHSKECSCAFTTSNIHFGEKVNLTPSGFVGCV